MTEQSASDMENTLLKVALGTLGGIGTAEGAGLSLPLPFANRICLIPDACVAGTTHVSDIDGKAAALAPGQTLRLQRDPDNPNDCWAIKVFDGSTRLGFMPRDCNEIPARLMDGGKSLSAQVIYVEKIGNWNRIHMEVYLDD